MTRSCGLVAAPLGCMAVVAFHSGGSGGSGPSIYQPIRLCSVQMHYRLPYWSHFHFDVAWNCVSYYPRACFFCCCQTVHTCSVLGTRAKESVASWMGDGRKEAYFGQWAAATSIKMTWRYYKVSPFYHFNHKIRNESGCVLVSCFHAQSPTSLPTHPPSHFFACLPSLLPTLAYLNPTQDYIPLSLSRSFPLHCISLFFSLSPFLPPSLPVSLTLCYTHLPPFCLGHFRLNLPSVKPKHVHTHKHCYSWVLLMIQSLYDTTHFPSLLCFLFFL